MLTVALTGGIGTGKSTILETWRGLGAPALEADAIVHRRLGESSPLVDAIIARFGEEVAAAGGGIDRSRLAAIVFRDAQARADLEGLVHPVVYADMHAWLAEQAAAGAPLAVAEIPLLFETGKEKDFDRVVVTICDESEQVQRVVARGGDEKDTRRRLAAQWSMGDKVRRADIVIDTDGTLAETISTAVETYHDLLAQAEAQAPTA